MAASGSSAFVCLGERNSVNVLFDEQGGRVIEVHVKQDATVKMFKKQCLTCPLHFRRGHEHSHEHSHNFEHG